MNKLKARRDVTNFNTPVLDQNIYAIPEEHVPKIVYINTPRSTPEVLKRKYSQEANQYWQEVKDQERQEKAMKELERFADISSPSTYINLAVDKLRGTPYGTTNSQLPTGVKMLEDVLVPSTGGLVVKGGKELIKGGKELIKGGKELIKGGKDLAKKTISENLKKKHPVIWELSGKDLSGLDRRFTGLDIVKVFNPNYLETIPNLNQSFLDRLRIYKTLTKKQDPLLYENLVMNNDFQSSLKKASLLKKKIDKLNDSIDRMNKGVSLNTAKKLFPKTIENMQQIFLPKKISNIKGSNLEVTPKNLDTKPQYIPKPILNSDFPSISVHTFRMPQYIRNYDSKILDKYIKEINQKIGENGYISGSTPLIHKYNLPDVPGDLEITTTPERLDNLLKSLNLDRNQANIVKDNNLQTLRFSNFQDGINNSLDIDVIMPNGRMAHQIWSAQDPAAYSKWLQTQADNIPLSSEELFQLGRKDPANISLYDLIKRRGKTDEQIQKINNRSWSLLTPENLKNLSQVHTNIAKTYHPQYKTFKEQFPDFDYANIEANRKLLDDLGYDPRFAENPENMQDLLEILNSNQLMGRQVRPNGDIPFEEMEKSIWSPHGGTASGAGGNTTNGFIGAEGYAGDDGAVGILQNVRTGDPLKNSEDYLKQFQLERFEDKSKFLTQNLPEKMQQDLSGFNIKTNVDLDRNLRGLDPNSELGKQIYPILDKYGYRSTTSTRAYNNKGDGSFYVGNLNPNSTVTSYPVSKIPYIELPHHNAMYIDPYNLEVNRMKLNSTEIPKYLTLTNKAKMGLVNKRHRVNGLLHKFYTLTNTQRPLRSPSRSWVEGYRYPLIPEDIKDATAGILGISSSSGLMGYALYQSEKKDIEHAVNIMNSLLRRAEYPEIAGEQDLYEYFKEHPHSILNADNVYNSASDRDLYLDLLNKLNASKNK